METKQLEPAEIIRSEMGTWTHPEYAKYLDEKLAAADGLPAAVRKSLKEVS